jgi:hypothetical protein
MAGRVGVVADETLVYWNRLGINQPGSIGGAVSEAGRLRRRCFRGNRFAGPVDAFGNLVDPLEYQPQTPHLESEPGEEQHQLQNLHPSTMAAGDGLRCYPSGEASVLRNQSESDQILPTTDIADDVADDCPAPVDALRIEFD